jgi:hypothetical protein
MRARHLEVGWQAAAQPEPWVTRASAPVHRRDHGHVARTTVPVDLSPRPAPSPAVSDSVFRSDLAYSEVTGRVTGRHQHETCRVEALHTQECASLARQICRAIAIASAHDAASAEERQTTTHHSQRGGRDEFVRAPQ